MTRSVRYSRTFVSIALVFCMLFGMMGVVDADISVTLYPLGANSRSIRNFTPERYTIKIYISGGKSGSALKKDSLPGWITVNSSNANYYIATVTGNTTNSVRRGSIIFTKGNNNYELYITQDSFRVMSTPGSSSCTTGVIFASESETRKLYTSFSCNLSGTIPEWLTVKKNDIYAYTITVKSNPTVSKRSCTLYFTKTLSTYEKVTRTVTITQQGMPIKGVPESITFARSVVDYTFLVETATGHFTATVGSNCAYWINTSKSGNYLTIHLKGNNTLHTRKGYVDILSGNTTKRITIEQVS